MKIELIKEIVPIPKKSTGRRDTPEGKADRRKAYSCLARCEVGQHVRFGTSDRPRIMNWLAAPRFDDRCFRVARIDDHTYGAWRVR